MDAFQSPSSSGPKRGPTGELDLGRAIAEGVGAMLGNLGPTLLVALLGGAAYVVSICTCVGWIAIVPLAMWGVYAYVLKMMDGPADMRMAVSGIDDFVRSFTSMWGLLLLLFVVYLPPIAVGAALAFPSIMASFAGESVDVVRMTAYTSVPVFIWSLVVVRFMFTPFLIVDRGRGVIDAFSESWSVAGPHWLKLMALQVVLTLLNLPSQVLNVGSQLVASDIDPTDLDAQLAAMPAQFGLQFAGIVVAAIAGLLGLAFFASAYRQVFGEAPEPRIP